MAKPKVPVQTAAVIGHPIAHSLSPAIFGFLARRTGVKLDYHKLDIAPRELAAALELARSVPAFTGWNVTIPHKETIARACDRLSAEARAVGAVNVVSFVARGQRIVARGDNTDVLGVARTLQEQSFVARGSSVLILGAGGAARAAAYALGRAGAGEVIIANRTLGRARTLARAMGRLFPRTRFRARALVGLRLVGPIDLCIQATPVGMKGFQARSLLPAGIGRDTLAFDMVYRPRNTPFLREAAKRGCATVGGLDMLVWQALGTFQLWQGKLPERRLTELKHALKRRLETELGDKS